jgi:hypothetical protein
MLDAARRLAVLVDHELCGTITGGPGLAYDFSYTDQWIGHRRPALRQVDKIATAVDRAIDDRVALHQGDDTTAQDLLETTRIELHERCQFVRGIVG